MMSDYLRMSDEGSSSVPLKKKPVIEAVSGA